jgi:uncharacterized protein YdcH (DUF465 family)
VHCADPFQWRLLLASIRALKYHFAGFETGLSNQPRRGKSMSFSDTEALKSQLLANDAQFAELAHTHGEYERRLSELAELHYPSVEEQMEEATLKKKKLFLKDQMETIMRRYKERQQVAGH